MRRSTRASLSQAVALVLVLLLGALVAASAAQTYGARGAQKPHGCVPGPGGSCAATGATHAGRARRQSLSQLKSQHALAAQARREQEAARQREARRLATAEVDSSGEDGQLRILPPPSQSPEYLAARRPSRERGWVAPDERRMSADARQAYITAVGSGGHTAAADVRSKQRLGGDDGTAHLHAGVRGYVVANSHRRQLLEAEVTTAAPLSDEELASPVLGCLLCDGVTAALQVEAYQQLRARSGTGTLSSDGRYEVISSDVSWENACLNLRDYVVLAAGAGGGGYTVRHVGSHHEHSAVGDGFVDAVATAKLHAACPKYKGTLRLRDALAYQIAHAADPLGAVARREACALAMGAAGLQCATDVIMDL